MSRHTWAVGALALEHPVLNASGTCDPLAALAAGLPVHEDLAAIVTKTVTPLPRAGNPAPRVAESAGWLLNSIGLANPGIEAFAAEVLPAVAALGRPVVVSVGGFSAGDYAGVVAALEGSAAVALELNVSCPNVETGCAEVGSDPDETRAVVEACRARSSLPLWVKLPPGLPDVSAVARAAEAGGADALVLTNTARGLALDPWTLEPALGGGTGGLSGPPLRPLALAAVHACRAAVALPIVGVGGIVDGADAIQFLAAGAAAVEVGTVLFREPRAARRVRAEVEADPRVRDLATVGPIAQPST